MNKELENQNFSICTIARFFFLFYQDRKEEAQKDNKDDQTPRNRTRKDEQTQRNRKNKVDTIEEITKQQWKQFFFYNGKRKK